MSSADAKTPPDPALIARAEAELSRSVLTLIRAEPFFGHLLSGINRGVRGDTETVGVSFREGRPLLSVNPQYFVEGLPNDAQRVAAIKHEVLHLLLNHAGRESHQQRDKQLYDLATDLVVNQMIGKWPLPDGAITLDSFEFELLENQTVEWYYEELKKHAEEISEEMEPEHSDHGEWSEQDEVSETVADNEMARITRGARDRAGERFNDTPDEIKALVDSWVRQLEPKVDWRRVIRMFTASSRRTRVSNTLRRPSKRYGTYPGIKVKRFHRLAVILDTSGSIDDALLATFFAEVRSIWRQGSEVTVIEADASVQQTWIYRGHTPEDIGGRGGTRFDPALSFVAEASPAFDAAIYLTDGKAQPPTVNPGCKVLWVLPANGSEKALRDQRIVRLPG